VVNFLWKKLIVVPRKCQKMNINCGTITIFGRK
jgi:hypothetical protein